MPGNLVPYDALELRSQIDTCWLMERRTVFARRCDVKRYPVSIAGSFAGCFAIRTSAPWGRASASTRARGVRGFVKLPDLAGLLVGGALPEVNPQALHGVRSRCGDGTGRE